MRAPSANLEIGAWRTSAGDVDVLLGIPAASQVKLARYDRLADFADSRSARQPSHGFAGQDVLDILGRQHLVRTV